ncbi:MAG: alanine dehydrogenase [Prochloron sp. SP5CPC1]|nr:alanine dehydrogenase [Candidatus Paraprochloron terpiosi SP5CPC1]
MEIGVPKEIKDKEYRVGLSPDSVQVLTENKIRVFVQTQAGVGAGFTDQDYQLAGATIVESAAAAWQRELIVKVKEPLLTEYKYLNKKHILFTYLHLAADRVLTKNLLQSGVTAIAYETVTVDGKLPLLMPMSMIAGRLSVQFGAHYLEKSHGRGVLLPGKRPPLLVPRSLVAQMVPGSVIVDVAVDQGGCIETMRPTSHSHPTYIEEGVVHVGIPNLPGAVPWTATQALNHSILPYVLQLAKEGTSALENNPALAQGLNIRNHQLVHPAVQEVFPDLV